MLVSDFNFDLPEDLIAQQPPALRGSSRMLQLNRATGAYRDRQFIDLPSLLQPGDLLVLNDSRVLPARLFATRAGLTTQHNSPAPSGHVEVLLTQPLASPEGHNDWSALVRPAKKVQPGETLLFFKPSTDLSSRPERSAVERPAVSSSAQHQIALRATVLTAGDFGERTLRFSPTADFHATLERIGHLPLPPYIHREKQQPNTPEDRERYQTVYSTPFARTSTESGATCPDSRTWFSALPQPLAGSAAAPTAGLHFTPEILSALTQRGVEVAHITLHVGLGTFQPVRVDRTEDIRLHAEPYTLSATTAAAINRAKSEGRRIIAVGTTTTRTLEHIARESERTGVPIAAHSGNTSLFLSPGLNEDFKLVQGLLTNFHLPQSTLLMLVSAFAGREAVHSAYAHAVTARYRFFSYGDCMLIL
jgi:S-adenosylmethionine:tRNA ribosyltransferase-isomerase